MTKEGRVRVLRQCYQWTNLDIATIFDVSTNTVVNWVNRGLPGKLHRDVFDLLIRLHARAEEKGVASGVEQRIRQAACKGVINLIVIAHAELQALE